MARKKVEAPAEAAKRGARPRQWRAVPEAHKLVVLAALRAAQEAEPNTHKKAAYAAALGRLATAKAPQARSALGANSYHDTGLTLELSVEKTRPTALARIKKAIVDAAGMKGAAETLGVSLRTLHHICRRDEGARAAKDEALASLSTPGDAPGA